MWESSSIIVVPMEPLERLQLLVDLLGLGGVHQPGEEEHQQIDYQHASRDPQHHGGPGGVDGAAAEGQEQHHGLGEQKLYQLPQDQLPGLQFPLRPGHQTGEHAAAGVEERGEKTVVSEAGLPVEKKNSVYYSGKATDSEIVSNILSNPFRRFEYMKIMSHTRTLGIVQVDPSVWKKLTADDFKEIAEVCESKLEKYFSRLEEKV